MKSIFITIFTFLTVITFAQNSKKDTTTFDYGARIYDARIGRAMSVDPKVTKNNSPYNFNNSIKKSSFNNILDKYKLQLTIPKNFKEVLVKDNPNVKYQYALKHDSLDFEIRFLVTDINTALDLPNDKRSLSLFTSIVLNASGEVLPNIPKIEQLQDGLAKQEYNADWIASSSFFAKSKFSEGFKICSVLGVRKNSVAEFYIFFMIKDKEAALPLVSKYANLLKFE